MSLTTRKTHLSWYLDSGYSRHMTIERCMFQFLTPMHGGTITFGGNKKRLITGVGKIAITPYPLIDNVLFVVCLKHNFLSISQLCDNGYDVPLTRMSVSSRIFFGPYSFLPRGKVIFTRLELGELSDQNVSCLLSVKENHWV